MRAALLFWAKLVFCCMEPLKYCRNVADAAVSGTVFFVCPQVFGILSASACIIALCVLLARMGLGITVIQ